MGMPLPFISQIMDCSKQTPKIFPSEHFYSVKNEVVYPEDVSVILIIMIIVKNK